MNLLASTALRIDIKKELSLMQDPCDHVNTRHNSPAAQQISTTMTTLSAFRCAFLTVCLVMGTIGPHVAAVGTSTVTHLMATCAF